jgi:hypothetical protein
MRRTALLLSALICAEVVGPGIAHGVDGTGDFKNVRGEIHEFSDNARRSTTCCRNGERIWVEARS